jgi:PknH-like extracellular domain
MRNAAWALLLAFALGGCTQVVETAQPAPVPPVAPITAGQAVDLLSPEVKGEEGNLFATVLPEDCAGVAREVDPPFIQDSEPAATDGGHWTDEFDGREVFIEEMVGVYRANFDPKKAVADAARTIDSCRGKTIFVTTMREREHAFSIGPPVDSDSPNIALWSMTAPDWACDNLFVAAHNAAIEITTCGQENGYDVLALAHEALERIEKLANLTA